MMYDALSQAGEFRLRRRWLPGQHVDTMYVRFADPFRAPPHVAVIVDSARRDIDVGVAGRSCKGCRIWVQRHHAGPVTVRWCAVPK